MSPNNALSALQDAIPWEALQYVTGQINYGGRVADDNDRVLLTNLLKSCYSPAVLRPDFSFTSGGGYSPPPPEADLAACVSHVQGLPATDTAQVFGMHSNADTAFQLQVSFPVDSCGNQQNSQTAHPDCGQLGKEDASSRQN